MHKKAMCRWSLIVDTPMPCTKKLSVDGIKTLFVMVIYAGIMYSFPVLRLSSEQMIDWQVRRNGVHDAWTSGLFVIAELYRSAVLQFAGSVNNGPASTVHCCKATWYSVPSRLASLKVMTRPDPTWPGCWSDPIRVNSLHRPRLVWFWPSPWRTVLSPDRNWVVFYTPKRGLGGLSPRLLRGSEKPVCI